MTLSNNRVRGTELQLRMMMDGAVVQICHAVRHCCGVQFAKCGAPMEVTCVPVGHSVDATSTNAVLYSAHCFCIPHLTRSCQTRDGKDMAQAQCSVLSENSSSDTR